MAAENSPEVSPANIRKDPKILEKLMVVANAEIQKNNVDTFTLGCGSFIGIAAPLQMALRKEFGNHINVVDPVATSFHFMIKKISLLSNF